MTRRGDCCVIGSRPDMDAPTEPVVRIGITPPQAVLRFFLCGRYDIGGATLGPGWCTARAAESGVSVGHEGDEVRAVPTAILSPHLPVCSFTVPALPVGSGFHWCHNEDLTYVGTLEIIPAGAGQVLGVNRIGVEAYLESVISSEMNPRSPDAFLEAHAIVARSWTIAQMAPPPRVDEPRPPGVDIWEWFDRANHEAFDLCSDDHCQRYHGQSRWLPAAAVAVRRTRGLVLEAEGVVVDARFSKCCGGVTEVFATAWGGPSPPGLASVVDAPSLPDAWSVGLHREDDAAAWFHGSPPVYCGDVEGSVLDRILLPMDRATEGFFRWKEQYSQERLAATIETKTNAGLGEIVALTPLRRGASGRLELIQIEGTKGVLRAGKELVVRRLLSSTHLRSSAFVVVPGTLAGGLPRQFSLVGAGWGHGVGMCQIGAGAMAAAGMSSQAIISHYFPRAAVVRRY